MDAQGINNIDWVDVHVQPDSTNEIHADLETVRERLHVKNADGSVLVGTDAFAALFERTNGQRTLGRMLKIAGIRSLSQIAYNAFARILYRWNRIKGRW
jgi:predicted DCC family thiol-disulfide oxidoreductase YuxK